MEAMPIPQGAYQTGSSLLPFVSASPQVSLFLKTQQVKELTDSLDGVNWGPWEAVLADQAKVNIHLGTHPGTYRVLLRIRNAQGLEGAPKEIYYVLDQEKPTLAVRAPEGKMAIRKGKLEFDLEIADAQSRYVGFILEVTYHGQTSRQEGIVKQFIPGKATTTTITITQLPKDGPIQLKVTAVDEGGNQTTEVFRSITSIE